jgi:hypothetical protein
MFVCLLGTRRVRTILFALGAVTGMIVTGGIATGAPAHSPDIYVSPFGSDNAPGTAWQPVRTVQRAKTLVHARDQDLTADLTVHLAPGTFRLAQPLQLTAGIVPVTLTATATGYTASAPTMANWRNPGDIQFVYTAAKRCGTCSDSRTISATGRDSLPTQPTAKGMTSVINGLKPGTRYTFTIAAMTADGAGAPVSVSATV